MSIRKILLKNNDWRDGSIENLQEDMARIRDWLSDQDSVDMTQEVRIRKLQQENAEMKLYLAALVRLLVDEDVISKTRIKEMIRAIDASDGQSDAQFGGALEGA